MKCICGYSTSGNFPNYTRKQQISPIHAKIDFFDNLFVCPSCGTLKVGISKKDREERLHGDANVD